jgi:hypothetical protein
MIPVIDSLLLGRKDDHIFIQVFNNFTYVEFDRILRL